MKEDDKNISLKIAITSEYPNNYGIFIPFLTQLTSETKVYISLLTNKQMYNTYLLVVSYASLYDIIYNLTGDYYHRWEPHSDIFDVYPFIDTEITNMLLQDTTLYNCMVDNLAKQISFSCWDRVVDSFESCPVCEIEKRLILTINENCRESMAKTIHYYINKPYLEYTYIRGPFEDMLRKRNLRVWGHLDYFGPKPP